VGNFTGGARGAVGFRGPHQPFGVPGMARSFPGFTPFGSRFTGFIGFNNRGFNNRGFNRFNNGGLFCDGFGRCFNRGFFPRHHHRFSGSFGLGFGEFPFGGAWSYGYPHYGGYYGDSGYDQSQYVQYQMAQNEQLMGDLEEDRRRQMELSETLADLQAAQAADAARSRQAPSQPPSSTSPDRKVPPTVLIFRDRHQVEISDYAIYDNTLLALDPNQRARIPLSELDLQATVQANEARGITFHVPGARTPAQH
jgi:hypothetical protein